MVGIVKHTGKEKTTTKRGKHDKNCIWNDRYVLRCQAWLSYGPRNTSAHRC